MRSKKILLCLGLGTGLSVMILGGCSGSKTAQESPVASSGDGKGTAPAAAVAKQENNALVRFVNATPSSKDLSFGDETPFTNVGSRDVTEYLPLPATRRDFKLITNSNTGKAMATNNQGLTAGKHYTVVAVTQADGTFTLDPIDDDLTPPPPGKAKVRVINLAPGVNSVNLYYGTAKDPLISGISLDHPTDYKEVTPDQGTLNIENPLNKAKTEAVKDVPVEAGKLYTILVFGNGEGKLKVKRIEDVFTQAPNGTKS